MSHFQMIALDMDGTLLTSEKTIQRSSLQSLRKAHQSGKLVVLSTGRVIDELKDYIRVLPFVRYGVLESGAMVYDFKKKHIIHKICISKDIMIEILKASYKTQPMLHIMSHGHVIVQKSQLDNLHLYHMSVYKDLYDKVCIQVDDIYDYVFHHIDEIEKINLFHTSQKSRLKTRALLKDLPIQMVDSEETALEINLIGINKVVGLKKLCDYLHISMSDVIGVGDALNDKEVLSMTGLSIAMGNAVSEIKQLAHVIVNDNDHNGISDAVKYLL